MNLNFLELENRYQSLSPSAFATRRLIDYVRVGGILILLLSCQLNGNSLDTNTFNKGMILVNMFFVSNEETSAATKCVSSSTEINAFPADCLVFSMIELVLKVAPVGTDIG